MENPVINKESSDGIVVKSGRQQLVYLVVFILFLFLLIIGVYALTNSGKLTSSVNSGNNTTLTPSTAEGNNPTDNPATPEVTDENAQTTIQVYLFDSIKFDIPDNTDYVTKVARKTTREDVGTFALEEIIKGPTAAEKTAGLAATFGDGNFVWFTGNSNCAAKDFTLNIVNKKATVRFCKAAMVSGDMSGGIVGQQIENTLKQFSSVEQVRILDVTGNCFDDMKGVSADECWE